MLTLRPPRSLENLVWIIALGAATCAWSKDIPTVYFPSQFREINEAVSQAYEGRFHVSHLPMGTGFTYPVEFQSGKLPVVRNAAGEPMEASVTMAYVVFKNGRVVDPVAINATNEEVYTAAAEYLRQRRYFPGSFLGTVVPVVRYEKIDFRVPAWKGFLAKETRFLNPIDTAQRCTPGDLEAYVQRLRDACADYFKNADSPETLYVIVVLLPKVGARIWLKSSRHPELTPERISFRNQLEAISPCPVGRGPVIFSFWGEIAGGDGPEVPEVLNGYTPLIPKNQRASWQEEYYFGDSLLEAAWYLEDR